MEYQEALGLIYEPEFKDYRSVKATYSLNLIESLDVQEFLELMIILSILILD